MCNMYVYASLCVSVVCKYMYIESHRMSYDVHMCICVYIYIDGYIHVLFYVSVCHLCINPHRLAPRIGRASTAAFRVESPE